MPAKALNTRQRLVEVAAELFAAKGYRQATVAEICRRARANIAAVNYHFGGKEALYREAWRHAHQQMLERFPPDGGVPASAPAANRLRGRIRSILQRSLADANPAMRIMSHEMESPTGLLHEAFRDAVRPLRQAVEKLIAELLGHADGLALQLCQMSVIAPCLHVMHARRHHDELRKVFGPDALDTLVDHFTAFALAGINQKRQHRAAGPARNGSAARSTRSIRGKA